MSNTPYLRGFMNKLAEYEKSAKNLYEMTDEERATAKALDAKATEAREAAIPKREYIPWADTFSGALKNTGKRLANQAGSLGRGMASAAGVAAIRAGEGMFNLATFPLTLPDELILGGLFNVNGGKGLFGRATGALARKADEGVSSLRNWSRDYDYRKGISGNFNRFMNGTFADAVGGFAGFGGAGALISRKMLPTMTKGLFGGLGAYEGVTGERQKQLRERGDYIRSQDPRYWSHLDPTSTPWNQKHAPTQREYQRYNLPSSGLPTSINGTIKVPYLAGHTVDGTPTQFIEYGN